MKNKLSNIFSSLSEYEEDQNRYPSPEYIAYKYSEWRTAKTGNRYVYFKNKKRNSSKAWKKFVELSELINEICYYGLSFPLDHYFDKQSEFMCQGNDLYPNQLVSKLSSNIINGQYYISPEMFTDDYSPTYEEEEKRLSEYHDKYGMSLDFYFSFFTREFVKEFCKRNNLEYEYNDE
ncbi:MAG: hypothetical protein DHS20C13_29590 [Thermodesulfobacteriota bacterium]|nr:MAG: hypothetical protein DHS20C13_29590 [Thermodesulfobacteriota bacterium]